MTPRVVGADFHGPSKVLDLSGDWEVYVGVLRGDIWEDGVVEPRRSI